LDSIASSWFYPGTKEYNENINPLPYDPQRARRLLKKAGWADTNGDGVLDKNGEPFQFTFLYPAGNPFYDELGALMQSNFAAEGIAMKLSQLDWAVFMERLRRHEFQACSLLWQLRP